MDIELFYQDLKSYWDTDILTIAKMYSLDGDVDSLRRQIAMIHASKRGNMLSGGVMSFVERLPELQRVAVERNDRSFPNVGKEYVDRLLELVTDQKQFKRDLKRMTPEQKRQVETELNQLESALKNNNDWNTIQRIRELFDIPQQYFDWTLKSYIRGTIHRLEDVSSRLKPAISDFEWLKKKDKIDRKEKIQQFNGLTSLVRIKYRSDLARTRYGRTSSLNHTFVPTEDWISSSFKQSQGISSCHFIPASFYLLRIQVGPDRIKDIRNQIRQITSCIAQGIAYAQMP